MYATILFLKFHKTSLQRCNWLSDGVFLLRLCKSYKISAGIHSSIFLIEISRVNSLQFMQSNSVSPPHLRTMSFLIIYTHCLEWDCRFLFHVASLDQTSVLCNLEVGNMSTTFQLVRLLFQKDLWRVRKWKAELYEILGRKSSDHFFFTNILTEQQIFSPFSSNLNLFSLIGIP